MRGWFYILMTALFMLVATGPGMAESAPAPGAIHCDAAGRRKRNPGGGRPHHAGHRRDAEKGWHGYWKNGGDAGLPTEAHWTLPGGASAGSCAIRCPDG